MLARAAGRVLEWRVLGWEQLVLLQGAVHLRTGVLQPEWGMQAAAEAVLARAVGPVLEWRVLGGQQFLLLQGAVHLRTGILQPEWEVLEAGTQ